MNKNIFFIVLAVFWFIQSSTIFTLGKFDSLELEEEKFKIYVVTHGGPSDPFWGVVMKGAEDAGEKYNCDVTYIGPEKFSIQKLVDMVETAIAGKPDGLVVTVTDIIALDKPLKDAIKEGIPVIAINVPDSREVDERIPYLTYIGADDYMVGIKAGERMLQEFGEEKPEKGVILVHQVGHAGLEARAKGISEIFLEQGIPIEKLAGSPNASENYQAMEAYLIKNPETDSVFALGPLGAEPILNLFADRNLRDKIKLGSVDFSIGTIRAIREGLMIFTIEQQQYLQGYLPISLLSLYLKYGLIPQDDIITGPVIVDKKNINIVADMVNKRFR